MRDFVMAHIMGGQGNQMMVEPGHQEQIISLLNALGDHKDAEEIFMNTFMGYGAKDGYWPEPGSWEASYKPYKLENGILQIPVKGVLLHNFPYAIGSYATGYYYIQKALERGLADPYVRGIALICDTPGGMVAGCFECGDKIFEGRAQKPIVAFAAEHAFSAGYAIASAAHLVTVTKTGGVGSIGVVTSHTDHSKMLDNAGLNITFIFAGKHKVDGNPYQALSADAKERIQTRIDATYGIFCKSVARNRKMSEDAVRATEALCYTAQESVDERLADRIASFDDALSEFETCLLGEGVEEEDTIMAITPEEKAQHEKDLAAAKEAGRQEASASATQAASVAAKAAKDRIVAIKSSDEAKKRPVAADACAMKTDMSVEDAAAFLASLPEEKPETSVVDPKATNSGNTDFKAAMDGAPAGPKAGEETDDKDEAKKVPASQRILAAAFGASK